MTEVVVASDDFDYSWLDVGESDWLSDNVGKIVGEKKRAPSMQKRLGAEAKDRVWACDGKYIWFRRKKSNPHTLQRHNAFISKGDYVHVDTQDDVEIYELQESSAFKKREVNLGEMNFYNVRRQAALAACRHDYQTFEEIMVYLKESIDAYHGANVQGAQGQYAETYMSVMAAIAMRNGPSPAHVNQQLLVLAKKRAKTRDKIISVGRG